MVPFSVDWEPVESRYMPVGACRDADQTKPKCQGNAGVLPRDCTGPAGHGYVGSANVLLLPCLALAVAPAPSLD